MVTHCIYQILKKYSTLQEIHQIDYMYLNPDLCLSVV